MPEPSTFEEAMRRGLRMAEAADDDEPAPGDIVADEEHCVTLNLKIKTIALRDAGIAYKRAQEEYRAALEAFNRFVAPEPTP